MFRHKFNLLFDAPDTGAGGGVLDKQGIFDALNADDDKSEKIDLNDDDDTSDEDTSKSSDKDKKSTKKNDKDDAGEEEVDDLKLLEEDLLDDEDEEKKPSEDEEIEQELVAPVRRKEILKAYPDLFKKFPYIERALYVAREFREMFPTMDDARKATTDSKTLSDIDNDLNTGNIEHLLTAVKNGNQKAFLKMADGYIETLRKVDEKAYSTVVGNVISHAIYAMATKARGSKNDELLTAARELNKFFFDKEEYQAPTKLFDGKDDNTPDPERTKLEQEKQAFLQSRFNTVSKELDDVVMNAIRNTITDNIDPKNVMNDYVKKNASREALETVNKLLVNDARFKSLLDKLWLKASQNNFDRESVNKIKSAVLGRARTLLPTAIKKAKFEALKGMGKRVKEDTDNEDLPADKAERPDRRDRSSNKESRSDRNKPQPGESSLDFLMRD